MRRSTSLPPETRVLREAPSDAPDVRTRDLRASLALVFVLLVLFGGLYAAAWGLAGEGLPRGSQVLGVRVGGLSMAQAKAKLAAKLDDRLTAPVDVLVDGEPYPVPPAQAGLSVDVAATLEQAGGRSSNPVELLRGLFGDDDLTPVVRVDSGKLAAVIARVADRADRTARNGAIRFAGGRVIVTAPRDGRSIDRDRAATKLAAAYPTEDSVSLPVRSVHPAVGPAEVTRALVGFARPAVRHSVRLRVGSGRRAVTVTLGPRQIAPHLSMQRSSGGRLEPKIDAAGLLRAVAPALAPVEQQPRSATFRIDGAKPVLVPARTGRQVTAADMERALLIALPRDRNRVVRLHPKLSRPALTTAAARRLGIVERVSAFTTAYPYAAYRLQNIHRAADLIDGTLLRPGQTFSLNATVGERTAANGFAIGTIISNGRFAEDFGGGTSQVATTTYNAAYFAGLEDVEHKPHSFFIDRYPVGREATVAWPSVDLRFRNDSGHGILISASYTDSTVTVSMYGTKRYDITSSAGPERNITAYHVIHDSSPSCVPQAGVPGFDIDVTRTFSQNDSVVRRETVSTHYNPAALVICAPDASREPPRPR